MDGRGLQVAARTEHVLAAGNHDLRRFFGQLGNGGRIEAVLAGVHRLTDGDAVLGKEGIRMSARRSVFPVVVPRDFFDHSGILTIHNHDFCQSFFGEAVPGDDTRFGRPAHGNQHPGSFVLRALQDLG